MNSTSLRPARQVAQLRTPEDVLQLQWTHSIVPVGFPLEDCPTSWVSEIVQVITTALDSEALPLNALRVQIRYRLESLGVSTRSVDGVYPVDEVICQAVNDPACRLGVYRMRSLAAVS